MPDKGVLDYASPSNGLTHAAETRAMYNRFARMISGAILLAGGVIAIDITGGHGDITGGVIGALGFILFLIELIRSYRN